MNVHSFHRSALYELVWTDPISAIAKRLEVKSTDIVKACQEANIPRPASGYWTKINFGKAPKRPELPQRVHGQSETVKITALPPTPRTVRRLADQAKTGELEVAGMNQSKALAIHQFVKSTERVLSGKKFENAMGLLSPDRTTHPAFDIQISMGSVERVLKLLNEICYAAEAQEIQIVEIDAQNRRAVAFQQFGEQVSLFVKEKVAREELKREDRPASYWKEYKYTPKGLLEIKIDAPYGFGGRSTWADGKIQRVEPFVHEIASTIKDALAAKRKNRLEQEERSRRWAEEEKIRKEKERQASLEKTRRERLLEHIDGWRLSERLTRFADAVEAVIPPEEEIQEWRNWIAWIRARAESMNPITLGKRPWHEWAIHVALSKEPESTSRLWQGSQIWDSLEKYAQ